MQKRGMVFGNYHTATHGWTLTGWSLGEAEPKTYYVNKPGGDGAWDYTTAMTDGLPRFNDRELIATFELSEGDRMSREREIRAMINELHGLSQQIELPDDDEHYLVGRVRVVKEYNDNAHAAITVTATCEPWKYKGVESWLLLTAAATEQSALVQNVGRRAVVPTVEVSAGATLGFDEYSWDLGAGVHILPDLLLTPGDHKIFYRGSGTIKLTYREAVLE